MKIIEKKAQSNTTIYNTNNYSLDQAIKDLGAYQQGEIELSGNETKQDLINIYIDNFDGIAMTASFLKNCQEIDKEYFNKIQKLSLDIDINVDYSIDVHELIYDIIQAWNTDPSILGSDIRELINLPAILTLSEEDEGIIVFNVADRFYKI